MFGTLRTKGGGGPQKSNLSTCASNQDRNQAKRLTIGSRKPKLFSKSNMDISVMSLNSHRSYRAHHPRCPTPRGYEIPTVQNFRKVRNIELPLNFVSCRSAFNRIAVWHGIKSRCCRGCYKSHTEQRRRRILCETGLQ